MQSNRREFIQLGGVGLAASPAFSWQRKPSPNDNIQVAILGFGIMGLDNVVSALEQTGVKLVAASDVYQGRLQRVRELYGAQVAVSRDYREILARQDVDAVIVATPDHWHAQMAIDAMNAGKDVYVEKPMVQKLEDGRRVVEAEKKTGRILQVGSQRVSSVIYEKARQLIRSGAIGEFNMVEAWWDRNSAIGAWQYSIPPDASPDTIDWDRFLGSAPKRPFEPIRLFRWRNYQDYGTGVSGDLFVHLFSGMHYILGSIGPARVFSTGGLRFWKDGRDVPDVMFALCDYPATSSHPAFNLALRVNFVDGSGGSSGFRFVGSEGVLTVGSGVTVARQPREKEPGWTIGTFPRAVQEEFIREYRKKYPLTTPTADAMVPQAEERFNPPRGYNDHRDHHRLFFESVRSRRPVVEDATFGMRAAGPALLANVSYFERRVCRWNAQNMTQEG